MYPPSVPFDSLPNDSNYCLHSTRLSLISLPTRPPTPYYAPSSIFLRKKYLKIGGCDASNSSRFSSFFPRIYLKLPNLVKLSEIWRHRFHWISHFYRTNEFHSCCLYTFWRIEQKWFDPEKNTEIEHYENLLKDSCLMTLESGVSVLYVVVTVWSCSIWLVSFNDPPFQLFELCSKNGSFERTR